MYTYLVTFLNISSSVCLWRRSFSFFATWVKEIIFDMIFLLFPILYFDQILLIFAEVFSIWPRYGSYWEYIQGRGVGEVGIRMQLSGKRVTFFYMQVPKHENFSLAFFTLSEPFWVCDLETRKKTNVFIKWPCFRWFLVFCRILSVR